MESSVQSKFPRLQDSPITPEEITSPTYSRTTTLVPTPSSPLGRKGVFEPHRHWRRIASALICFFAIGWGDAATGVILPTIQAQFHLNYVMGAMMFMTGSVGYALATFIVEPVSRILGRYSLESEKLSLLPILFSRQPTSSSPTKGRRLSLFVSGLLHCAYYLLAACSPSYEGVLIGFFIGGIGKSILIGDNVYWTTNPRANGIALLHGTYGIGAFVSPLVSQILTIRGYGWREFFWISLALAIFYVIYGLYAFHITDDEFKLERQLALTKQVLSQAKADQRMDEEQGSCTTDEAAPTEPTMWEILKMPLVWVVSTILCVYQGAETIAQGFIVTFLLLERNASPKTVGYVASGFWGGLATGRCIWGFLSPRCSQRFKIFYINFSISSKIPLIYSFITVLAMIFHVLIWRVDSYIANAVTVSFLGLLAGPTFPLVLDIVTNQNTKQMPGKPSVLPVFAANVQLTGLAIGSSMGAMGGATFSLVAGIAANKYGAFVVEPLAMATVGFVFCFWVGSQIVYKIMRK
ncbi:MFS general substrate transporter [Serendipita vermifera]|nr:MFS general substrate transporter [Serendipita vermifera]